MAAHHSTANKLRGKLQYRRKVLYSEKPAIWGESKLMSRDQLQTLCSAMTIFKGKKGKHSQLIMKAGGQILRHFSIACRPADFSQSSLGHCLAAWSSCNWMFSCLHGLPVPVGSTCKFTKGKLGVESQSFFNYRILHSYSF